MDAKKLREYQIYTNKKDNRNYFIYICHTLVPLKQVSNANLRAFNKLRIRVEWKKFLFYDEFMTIFEIKKKPDILIKMYEMQF